METVKDFTDLTFYLPWEYKVANDSEYFDGLIGDGVYYNIDRQPIFGSVHLALGAMHMIFMGVVYNYLMILSKSSPEEFNLTLIGFHHIIDKEKDEKLSWHDFSLISESSILDFFRGVGMNKSDIGKIKQMVKRRNDLMHANGVYIKDVEIFKEYSKKYLDCAKTLNQYCFDNVKKLFFEFVKSIEIKINDESEAESYISEYFSREHGISPKAFELLANVKIEDYPRNKNRKVLYDGVQKYLNNWIVDFD